MAAHLAIGQEYATLRADVDEAAIARYAQHACVTNLALTHLRQLHAGRQALVRVEIKINLYLVANIDFRGLLQLMQQDIIRGVACACIKEGTSIAHTCHLQRHDITLTIFSIIRHYRSLSRSCRSRKFFVFNHASFSTNASDGASAHSCSRL